MLQALTPTLGPGDVVIMDNLGAHKVAGGAETFAAGDRLAIISENPADATLANISITFKGTRT
jgi:hypothetical protein